MPTPLRPPGEGPESPESLMISSLLASGSFSPEKYHLSEDHLSCWSKLWRFCVEYQERAGLAPPLDLVKMKFPEYEFMEADPSWAANELHRASASRKLRSRLQSAIQAINDDQLDLAYSELEGLQRPRSARRDPADLWDHGVSAGDEVEVSKLPLPYPTLGRASGGVGPGELWYIGGRPGTGKSFMLCNYAAAILKHGYNIRYISLEMSAAAIHKRVRRNLAGSDAKLLARLDSKDRETYKLALEELRGRYDAGSLQVVDPSHGRATNAMVREQMDDADVVFVDHVGLMYTTDGRKAIEDWRAQALISNILKEDALSTGIPVIAAAQLNREAEAGTRAPSVGKLGGSDALGQDGDVVVTMRRLSPSVLLHGGEKIREGPGCTWYSRFDPERARFDEVDRETSIELQSLDDDRLAASR